MGWETDVSLGAGAINSFVNMDNAKAETKATAETAEYTAQNMANKTSRTEGSLETSFIKGGIALNGTTGVQQVFQQAGAQGTTDIQRTIDNANASINNTMNSARSQSLNTLAGSVSKLGAGTISNFFSTAWNGITGNPDPSPAGSGTAILDTSALDNFSTGVG